MSCLGCCLAPQREQDQPLIVDVEQAIADAAWANFLASYGKFRRRFLKRKDFKIEVPMNYYHFEQVGPQVFKTKPRSSSAAHAVIDPASSSKSRLEGRQLAHSDQTSPEHMGLETIFNNDTDKEQTYNFKFDKTRKASVSVTYQKGYSFGGKANFSLGLPKVMTDSSLGMDFNASVQVTKSSGEVFEESITTSANSQITVGSHSHYTASVVMQERNLLAEFELNMQMGMPAGRAPVYIRRKSTGEQVYAYSVCSLPEVFESYPDVRWVKDDAGDVKADVIMFHIEGLVNGMQLSSHVINLSGRSLQAENGKGGASGSGVPSGEGDGTDGGEKMPSSSS